MELHQVCIIRECFRQNPKKFMLRNYFRLTFRHLLRDKTHSLINIAGLAVGMAVVLLIAAWIYNECSYDKYNPNYDRIARVAVTYTVNGQVNPSSSTPLPLVDELRSRYGSAFTRLSRTARASSA
jgi:putative ABC transport system permease protein